MAAPRKDVCKTGRRDKITKSKRKLQNKSVKGEADEQESPNKKLKWSDYGVIEFKVEIKDPNLTFQAIKKFLEQANAFPSRTSSDIVADYCRSSEECEEICRLLEGKRKASEVYLIFETLECILLRLAQDLPKLKAVGDAIIRRILTGHVGLVYATLEMKNKSSHIKAALKLLTAMVMLGDTAAGDVATQLDLGKPCFQPLLQRREIRNAPDVRTCLMQFMMSLLISGDDAVITQVVNTKDFLNPMFAGLCGDRRTTIEMVLPVLLEKVVGNSAVPKTSKIRLFHNKTMKDISLLYKWTGVRMWSKLSSKEDEFDGSNGKAEDSTSEDQELVRNLCHEFLLTLCCDFKNGINFFDKTYATSGKNQNHILTNFMTSLDKPYLNEFTSDLVAEILKACPDQLYFYLPSLRASLTPRLSPKWLNCVDFVIKIYSNQPDLLPIFRLTEPVPTKKLLSMSLNLLIPREDIWNCVTSTLKNPSEVVRHGGLRLLHRVLLRCRATIEYCLQKRETSVHNLKDFLQMLRESLSKILPEFKIMHQCWNRALGRSIKGIKNEGKEEKSDSETEEPSTTEIEEVPKLEHLLKIVQNICLYQHILADELSEQPIDFPGLLEGIRTVCTDDSETSTLLQLYVMKCMATANTKHLSWMKEGAGGNSTLYLLLEMMTALKDKEKLSNIAISLLKQLFSSTGVLGGTEEEVTVWLQELCSSTESENREILRFLEQVFFTALIKDPYRFSEEVAELQQKVTEFYSENDLNDATSGATTSEALIDTILSMEEVDLNESDAQSKKECCEKIDVRLKLSPLLPAAIDILKYKEYVKTDAAKNYLQRVVLSILRTQPDGLPISLMVHNNSKLLARNDLHRIAKQWLPESMHQGLEVTEEVSQEDFEEENLSAKEMLQLCCQADTELLNTTELQDKVKETVRSVPVEECIPLTKQLLQYITLSALKMERMKSIGAVQLYTNLLKEILNTLITDPCRNNETKEIGAQDDEFLALMETMPSPVKLVGEFFKLLLTHEDIQKYFLASLVKHANKTSKIRRKLGHLLSSEVAALVSIAPKDGFTSKILLYFKEKTLESICDPAQSAKYSVILSCVGAFCKHFTSKEIARCLRFLSDLPRDTLIEDGNLTNHGKLIVTLMETLLEETSEVFLSRFPIDVLRNLVTLLQETNNPDLEKLYIQVLEHSSVCSLAASEELLHASLHNLTDQSLKLVHLLVTNSSVCRRWVENWSCASAYNKQRKKHMDKLWKVVVTSAALQSRDAEEFTNKMKDLCGDKSKGDGFYHGLWKISDCSHNLTVYPDSEKRQILELRCEHACLKENDTGSFVLKCTTFLLETVGKKDSALPREDVLEIAKLLSVTLKANKDDKNSEIIHVERKLCSQLIKKLLRNFYNEAPILTLLSLMVDRIQELKHIAVDTFQMVVSHSQFLPSMFDAEFTPVKDGLVELLTSLVKCDEQCCQNKLLPVLFGAYRATLNHTDQKLLHLLRLYEEIGCKLITCRPYLWGDKAVEHHAVKQNLSASLNKQASTEQVLDALDRDTLYQSCLHFPISMKMQKGEIGAVETLKCSAAHYDPRFLLPLFSHLVAPETLLNCRRFTETNCLGYVISALSSRDSAMRGAAYVILAAFYHQLEGARFPEKYQVLYLMDNLKNSVETTNQRLPCIITVFYVEATQLVIKPGALMYSPVNEFLLLKPSIDITNVPEFYKLFNSSAEKYKEQRQWILTLLENGLREDTDYRIFEKRNIFKLLQSFYDSALSDRTSQVQVLKILLKACGIKRIAIDLIKTHGFLSWVEGLLQNTLKITSLESYILDVVCVLWNTMSQSKSRFDQNENQQSPLPLRFISQMLLLCTTYLDGRRDFSSLEELDKYLQCLSSILEEQNKSVQHLKTESQQPCSIDLQFKHVLRLLYHWTKFCDANSILDTVKDTLSSMIPGLDTSSSMKKRTERDSGGFGNVQSNDSVTRLLQICCCLKFREISVGNEEHGGIEVILKMIDSCLAMFHLFCPKNNDISFALSKWIRDLFVADTSNLADFLLSPDCKMAKDIVCKMLYFYEMQPEINIYHDSHKKDTCRNINETLLHVLDSSMEDSSGKNFITDTLAKPEFKKLITRLKGQTSENVNVSEIAIILQEIFLRADKPIHSQTLFI